MGDSSRRVAFFRKSDKGGQEALAVSKREVMAKTLEGSLIGLKRACVCGEMKRDLSYLGFGLRN